MNRIEPYHEPYARPWWSFSVPGSTARWQNATSPAINIQARRKVLYAYPDNVYFGVASEHGRPSFPDRPAA